MFGSNFCKRFAQVIRFSAVCSDIGFQPRGSAGCHSSQLATCSILDAARAADCRADILRGAYGPTAPTTICSLTFSTSALIPRSKPSAAKTLSASKCFRTARASNSICIPRSK